MKPILISFFILAVAFQSTFGQVIEPTTDKTPQEIHDMYMQKRKSYKTLAWVTLGAGIAMGITGGALQLSGGILSDNPDKGVALFYAGGIVSLLSTPFFITAGVNKKKAKLALKGESISLKYNPKNNSNYVALSLTIPLGK